MFASDLAPRHNMIFSLHSPVTHTQKIARLDDAGSESSRLPQHVCCCYASKMLPQVRKMRIHCYHVWVDRGDYCIFIWFRESQDPQIMSTPATGLYILRLLRTSPYHIPTENCFDSKVALIEGMIPAFSFFELKKRKVHDDLGKLFNIRCFSGLHHCPSKAPQGHSYIVLYK
jgi:hypothetical protein